MKKRSFMQIILLLLIITLFTTALAACGAQKKPVIESKKKQEEKEPPEELDKLRDSIEKIEKSLQTVYEDSKKPLILLQQEMEKGQEKSQEQGGDKGGEEKKEGEGGQEKSSEKKLTPDEIKLKHEQEIFKKLEDIKKDTLELHTAWNSYEPTAVSDLAVQSSIIEFEAALNNLTKSVDTHEIYQSLLEVNELYKSLPDFYLLYKTKTPPELDRIRYSAKKIMLVSEKEDFATATETIQYLEGVWAVTKPKLQKDNLQVMNKFEFALSDLKSAVEQKNPNIIKAKSEVILKIADEIEKGAEKESE